MSGPDITRHAETIRQAFAAARLDERTPEEKGFAAVFESEIKPRIQAGVETNLRYALAWKRRRKIAWFITVPLIPALIYAFLPLTRQAGPTAAQLPMPFIGWVMFVVLAGVHAWANYKRPDEKDMNQTFVMEKVLTHFDCQLGHAAPSESALLGGSPILPLSGEGMLESLPEYVIGNFDRRMPFVAYRATARIKSGKNSSRTTFRGWYLRVELPFTFSGATVVRERGADTMIGLGGKGLQEVSLEDPDFSRLFSVGTTDQNEARVILTPDVMHHLNTGVGAFQGEGGLMLGFFGAVAHVWIPWRRTELSDWQPLHPERLVEDLHEAFAELSTMRSFLRDIDVIAQASGFRAQAARKTA